MQIPQIEFQRNIISLSGSPTLVTSDQSAFLTSRRQAALNLNQWLEVSAFVLRSMVHPVNLCLQIIDLGQTQWLHPCWMWLTFEGLKGYLGEKQWFVGIPFPRRSCPSPTSKESFLSTQTHTLVIGLEAMFWAVGVDGSPLLSWAPQDHFVSLSGASD